MLTHEETSNVEELNSENYWNVSGPAKTMPSKTQCSLAYQASEMQQTGCAGIYITRYNLDTAINKQDETFCVGYYGR